MEMECSDKYKFLRSTGYEACIQEGRRYDVIYIYISHLLLEQKSNFHPLPLKPLDRIPISILGSSVACPTIAVPGIGQKPEKHGTCVNVTGA